MLNFVIVKIDIVQWQISTNAFSWLNVDIRSWLYPRQEHFFCIYQLICPIFELTNCILFKFFSFWLAKMSQTKSYIRTKIVYLEYKCFDIYVQNESLRVPNYFISNKLSFRFKFKLIVKIILNFDVNKCISNWYF